LTGLLFANTEEDQESPSLLGIIQERIAQVSAPERRRFPWLPRWLNWFNHSWSDLFSVQLLA